MRTHVAAAWMLLLLVSQSLESQAINDELAVTTSTIAYYQERIGDRRLGVDPRVLVRPTKQSHSFQWADERSPGTMELVLMGTTSTPLRFDRSTCVPENPAGCLLAGVDSYLAMARPVVEGDVATVYIYTRHNIDGATSKYRVVNVSEAEVTLRKTAEGWRVVAFKVLGQS